MEYTGIYNNLLTEVIVSHKLQACLLHSTHIKNANGFDRLKNDKVDAQKIAKYAWRFRDKLAIWSPLQGNLQKIKTLMTERESLVKIKKQLSQRSKDYMKFIEKSTCTIINETIDPVLNEVNTAIEKLETKIRKFINEDSVVKNTYDILMSVPGIGEITTITLICYTANFTKFDTAKQLGCYCGVVPFEQSSGIYKSKAKVSFKSNKKIKTLLHMCALASIRSDNIFSKFYGRKIAEGKNKMSVINAVRYKILKTGFACVNNQTKFQSNFLYAA